MLGIIVIIVIFILGVSAIIFDIKKTEYINELEDTNITLIIENDT